MRWGFGEGGLTDRLEQERKELLVEGRDLDKKIEEIKARLAARPCMLT